MPPLELMEEYSVQQGSVPAEKDDDLDTEKNHTAEEPVKPEEDEENSPIPEVAAIVSNKDDPSLPVMTFRYYIMAILFSLVLSFFNQFLYVTKNRSRFIFLFSFFFVHASGPRSRPNRFVVCICVVKCLAYPLSPS